MNKKDYSEYFVKPSLKEAVKRTKTTTEIVKDEYNLMKNLLGKDKTYLLEHLDVKLI